MSSTSPPTLLPTPDTPNTTPPPLPNSPSTASSTETLAFGILSAVLAIGSIILAYLQLLRMRRKRLKAAKHYCEMHQLCHVSSGLSHVTVSHIRNLENIGSATEGSGRRCRLCEERGYGEYGFCCRSHP